MALGSTQPLTEMTTRGKGGRCVGLTTLPPLCALNYGSPHSPGYLRTCPDLYRGCFDGQCTCKHNSEARSQNHCYRTKARNITNSECVSVALFNQYAKRMRLITLSSAVCLALPHFSTSSNKRHDFRGKNTEHKEYVLISYTTSV